MGPERRVAPRITTSFRDREVLISIPLFWNPGKYLTGVNALSFVTLCSVENQHSYAENKHGGHRLLKMTLPSSIGIGQTVQGRFRFKLQVG